MQLAFKVNKRRIFLINWSIMSKKFMFVGAAIKSTGGVISNYFQQTNLKKIAKTNATLFKKRCLVHSFAA
jgi:hypothetical protein